MAAPDGIASRHPAARDGADLRSEGAGHRVQTETQQALAEAETGPKAMAENSGVTEQDVLRVAELANLELTSDEVPRMQRDLSAILGHVAQLEQLNSEGVPAMSQVGEMLGTD